MCAAVNIAGAAKGASLVNLAHIIDPHPADRVAIFSRGRPTTYGALRDQVAHVRGGLAKLGVGNRRAVVVQADELGLG